MFDKSDRKCGLKIRGAEMITPLRTNLNLNFTVDTRLASKWQPVNRSAEKMADDTPRSNQVGETTDVFRICTIRRTGLMRLQN